MADHAQVDPRVMRARGNQHGPLTSLKQGYSLILRRNARNQDVCEKATTFAMVSSDNHPHSSTSGDAVISLCGDLFDWLYRIVRSHAAKGDSGDTAQPDDTFADHKPSTLLHTA